MPISQLTKVMPKSAVTAAASAPRALTKTITDTVLQITSAIAAKDDPSIARIEVHDTVSNVAWAYERLRNAIDYQDEHLLRKNAIERMLRRRLVSGATATQIAEPLILELIRGRYLPNNSLPTTIISQASDIINTYILLWIQVPKRGSADDNRKLQNFWFGLMSVELNELFAPSTADEAIVNLAHQILNRDIGVSSEEMTREEKDIQIYIAAHRALLKSDQNMIRYHLFVRQWPQWQQADEQIVSELAAAFPEIRDVIESQIFHRSGEVLQRVVKQSAAIFWIFRDLIDLYGTDANTKLQNELQTMADATAAYTERRKSVSMKVARTTIRSIIYVFLTKMLLALLVELPLDKLVAGGDVSLRPLFLNVTVPPLILILLGVTNRLPGEKNLEELKTKLGGLLYRTDEKNALVQPRKPIRPNTLFTYFFRLFYAAVSLSVFGLLVWGLSALHFSVISMFIFLLFLTIVSFFGIRVRLLAKELQVTNQRDNIFSILFDFFTVPILQVGRWIALRAPRVNVLIFFFDVIVETPFKAFLETTEGFFGFLREKREEIY